MMSQKNRFTNRFDMVGMWFSLLTYFTVWFVLGSWLFTYELVWPALVLALVYVAMHIFEIKFRQHCFLSADSTAAPVSLLAFFCIAFIAFHCGVGISSLVDFATGALAAFMFGHLLALSVAASIHFCGLLAWKFVGQSPSERT